LEIKKVLSVCTIGISKALSYSCTLLIFKHISPKTQRFKKKSVTRGGLKKVTNNIWMSHGRGGGPGGQGRGVKKVPNKVSRIICMATYLLIQAPNFFSVKCPETIRVWSYFRTWRGSRLPHLPSISSTINARIFCTNVRSKPKRNKKKDVCTKNARV